MHTDLPDTSKSQQRIVATYVLAISIFCLSGALVYFAWKLSFISEQIPDILTSVEHTSSSIEPVLQRASAITDLLPPMLHELSETRKLVTPILNEVRLTREQIPDVLHQVEETRKIIPQVLQTTDKVVEEIKTTREALPPMLDRADTIVSNARKAGKEASKGAVTGVFTGIIAAPFELIGGLGKRLFSLTDDVIKELTEKDLEMAKQALVDLLPAKNIEQTNNWKNTDTNVSGTVTLEKIYTIDDQPCKEFHVKISKKNQALVDKNTTICLNEDNEWEQRN